MSVEPQLRDPLTHQPILSQVFTAVPQIIRISASPSPIKAIRSGLVRGGALKICLLPAFLVPFTPTALLLNIHIPVYTKHHRLGGLNHRIYLLAVLDMRSPRAKCQWVQSCLRPPSFVADSHLLPVPSCGFVLCAERPGFSLCIQVSSFYKDPSQTDEDPTL